MIYCMAMRFQNVACKKLVEAQTPVVFNSDPLVTYLIMNGRLNALSPGRSFLRKACL